MRGCIAAKTCFEWQKCVEILRARGADSNAVGADGKTATQLVDEKKEAAAPKYSPELLSAMASIGDIDLDPRYMTWGKLKRIFPAKPKLDYSTENAVSAQWYEFGYESAVSAEFYTQSADPPNSARPIEISIAKPFNGSIRGVHIGDPIGKVVAIGQANGYKLDALSHDAINWDETWTAYFRDDGKRVTSIRLADRRYAYRTHQ
jgi:hypothetical protein